MEEKRPIVLVVEDHVVNRMVVKAMLDKLGWHPVMAENGQQALELLASGEGNPPALVLMDCQMPVMDGFEATRVIRAREAEQGLPRMPVVALTANAFAEDSAQCFAAGMDDFLSKPLALDALQACLKKHAP